jgi:uncharacterized protein YegP (UPF0339 family)
MQFETYRANGGQFHWRLVGDDRTELAVSAAAFNSAEDADRAATDVRANAGAASGPGAS